MRFGVAGYPPAFALSPYRKERLKIVNWLSDLGLDALELQMTYGPRTRPEVCREYKALADDYGISLSVHASYFIVFTSDDGAKIERSSDTLKRTYELCDILGADLAVLHPGPLYGGSPYDAMERFVENASTCLDQIGETDIGLFVETAGKRGQLGSVDEIIEIGNRIPLAFPCIDFGHVHARTGGTLKTSSSVRALFLKLKAHGYLSPESRVHFHFSPVDFGPRGEKKHKRIDDTYPASSAPLLPGFEVPGVDVSGELYHPTVDSVAPALCDFSPRCTVISETHNSQEEGALALREAVRQCLGK